MGVVANLKARLTMETDEYLAAAKKVTGETTKLGQHFRRTMSNLGRGYAKAAFAPELLAVQSVDEMLRGLADTIRTTDFSNFGKGFDILRGTESLVSSLISKVPLLGGMYDVGNAINERFLPSSTDIEGMVGAPNKRFSSTTADDRRKFTESLKPSQEAMDDLRYQAELARATTDEQRRQIELAHEREEILKKLVGIEDGPQKELMRQELESAIKIAQEEKQRYETRKKEEAAALDRAKERAAAEERFQQSQDDFMEQLEENARAVTMTERERFELKLQELELDEEQAARARQLYEIANTQKAEMPGSVSAVTGVSSAVGSIRMAGSIDYSQQRMASSLDMIKAASQKTSENTAKIAEAARAA